MSSKRLAILENSLLKKESLFDEKLQTHIDTVKQSNGQPLNDKRNGAATLNKWDKQSSGLRTLDKGIEKTKEAITREKYAIQRIESAKSELPAEILELIEAGELTQWRKYPNMFFVKGVDKARLIWDMKKKALTHNYVSTITDKEQYSTFAKVFNKLSNALNKKS